MVPQQQNQDKKPSGDSGGGRPQRSKNRNRRRPRKRKGKSPGGDKKEAKQPAVKFKPQSLVPLGQEPLPPTKVVAEKFIGLKKKKYGIVIYENFQEAEADLQGIEEKSKNVDILNIVIKAEGERAHPQLDPLGKVFAGQAWHLIHERRLEEGWYNEPQY